MALAFTRPYQLLPKASGAYVRGKWVPGAGSTPRDVLLNVQPAGNEDYQSVQNVPGGRTPAGILVALADEELQQGDVVMMGGERWEVMGRQRRAAFGESDTSHWKYLLAHDAVQG